MISLSALIDPWDQTKTVRNGKAKGLTGQKSHGLLTKQGLTTVQEGQSSQELRSTGLMGKIEPKAAKHRN